MAAVKGPGRATDGVNATFATYDEDCQITLANSATLATGQVVCLSNTSLGPANTVNQVLTIASGNAGTGYLMPNNVAAPVCEQVVLPTATGAGAVFGVYQGPAITNSSGSSAKYTIQVRQRGYGAVLAGAVAAGTAVTVGSSLITSSSNAFATVGTAAPFVTVGKALATYNLTTIAAATSSGSQTVTPGNMAGITTTTAVLVDVGTVQETVTPSAIGANSNTFTATFANAHPVNTPIAVIQAGAAGSLIAVPGAGSYSGIVAAFIQVI